MAQLNSATDYGSEGSRFESRGHKKKTSLREAFFVKYLDDWVYLAIIKANAKVYSINVNENGGVPKYQVSRAYIGKLRVEGDKQNDLKHMEAKIRFAYILWISL